MEALQSTMDVMADSIRRTCAVRLMCRLRRRFSIIADIVADVTYWQGMAVIRSDQNLAVKLDA